MTVDSRSPRIPRSEDKRYVGLNIWLDVRPTEVKRRGRTCAMCILVVKKVVLACWIHAEANMRCVAVAVGDEMGSHGIGCVMTIRLNSIRRRKDDWVIGLMGPTVSGFVGFNVVCSRASRKQLEWRGEIG